ncbi:MAG: hypothetical protein ACXAEN_19160 [Candidatus Thorarchaeota archaeon]|jgi:hypothetical protein
MTVSSTLPTIPPSQQPAATTTKEERIRVTTECGYSIRPHEIQGVARKNLSGARFGVWDVVWSKTIDWRKAWDSISISQFVDALPYNEKTIRRTLDWMTENNWLQSRPVVGSQIKQFQIHPDRIQVESIPESPQPVGQIDPGQNVRSTPDKMSGTKERSKERSINNPTLNYNTSMEAEVSDDWVGKIFKDSKKPGIDIQQRDALIAKYDGIYSPELIKKFVENVNMFSVHQKTIRELLSEQYDISQMVRMTKQVISELRPNEQANVKPYANRWVWRVRNGCDRMEAVA